MVTLSKVKFVEDFGIHHVDKDVIDVGEGILVLKREVCSERVIPTLTEVGVVPFFILFENHE